MHCIINRQPTYKTGITVDGEELELRALKKNDVERFAEAREKANGLDKLYDLLVMVLNCNTRKIEFNREDAEADIDILTAKTIIAEYTDFMHGVATDPN